MNTKRDITDDVIFRVFRKDGDVIAFWPAVSASTIHDYCQSYQHIGQHGGADYAGCLSITRLATPKEYKDLLAELKQIGYKPNVIKRATIQHRRVRIGY